MASAQVTRFDEHIEQQMRNVYQTLSEKDKRRFAAIQAAQLGHGGTAYIAEVLGCSVRTIRRGRDELDQLDTEDTPGRVRRPGAGRPKKSRPALMSKRI